MATISRLWVTIFLSLLVTYPLFAYQSNTPDTTTSGPKIGVVLSGGGAKGIMHISILKAMEEVNMPIDFIGGTSMGAIVGGMYAIGYSADDLYEFVRDVDWSNMLTDQVSRRFIPIEEKMWDSRYMLSLPIINNRISLPTGLISGQEISKFLTRLTLPVHDVENFDDFPIPFVAIATDLETGLPIIMRNGYLPDVMRSSMSIPSVFSPHNVNGKISIDGGVARNFPVTDVLEMGADYIIGINVSSTGERADTLSNIVSIMERTINYRIVQTTLDQARLVDYLIQPDIGDFNMADFDNIPEILRLSKEAIEEFKPRLKEIADSLNALRKPKEKYRYLPPEINELFIQDIIIHDTERTQEKVILSEFKIKPGTWASPESIEMGIDRIYSLQFFETVRYRLVPTETGTIVHLYLKEKLDDQFRVGLRYDNRHKSSLLFSASFRNTYKPTSTLRFNIRLGDETYYDTQFFYYVGFRPKLGVSTRANFSIIRDDLFDSNGNIFANVETESARAEFWVGPVVSSMLIMGAGIREEFYRLRRIVGSIPDETIWKNNHSFFAFLWLDTKNDGVFATNGQMFRGDYTQSFNWFGNSVKFSEYKAKWENYIPITTGVTGLLNFYTSFTYGEVPYHRKPYLGGYDNFPGFYKNEIMGDWLKSAQAGLQIEMMRNRFLIATYSAGQASDVSKLDTELYPVLYGWNLTAAAKTVIGPIKIGISGSERHQLLYDIRVGFDF
ncbi:MAG TPA: hypothetical protein DCE78_03200 [Bacteroidetes bacterium]|nr:hypothetical protein [Bacteroidota bacterium]